MGEQNTEMHHGGRRPCATAQPRIGVVILNYNGWQDTIVCAESVLASAEPPDWLIVVDNGSSDDSPRWLRHWAAGHMDFALPELGAPRPCPKPLPLLELNEEEARSAAPATLVLLRRASNTGYAAGNNAGIRPLMRWGADAVWILNNDTIVDAHCLGAMRRRLFAKERPGLCGAMLRFRHEDMPIQCLGGGVTNRWTALSRLTGQGLSLEEARRISAEEVERGLNFINGACVMASRAFLETVGLMDEGYFLYCEEQDWAYRSAGRFDLAYAPEALVYHHEGATTGWNGRKLRLVPLLRLTRSRIRLTAKHVPLALPLVAGSGIYAACRLFWRRLRAALGFGANITCGKNSRLALFPRGKHLARLELALVNFSRRRATAAPVVRPVALYRAPVALSGAKVCLFAHFDHQNRVDDSVFLYLDELRRAGYTLIFITSTRFLAAEDIENLKTRCAGIFQRENSGLDFASWKAALLALPELFQAQELLLANDSVYGPVAPLGSVLAAMKRRKCDFWGLTASREGRPHLQSYFLVFRARALRHAAFARFWAQVEALDQKRLIIRCYETTLTQRLALAGLSGAAYAPLAADSAKNPMLRHGLELARNSGLPVIKRQLLGDNPERISLAHWDIGFAEPKLPVAIRAHLARLGNALPAGEQHPSMTVLLPTRNGAPWLDEFLASCLKTPDIRLLARDDASTDETPALLQRWRERYPGQMEVHSGPRLGVRANVGWLLNRLDTDYFLLADQDDIWEECKIPALTEAMQRLELRLGRETPLLVYSDASLIDAAGHEFQPSWFAAAGFPPAWSEHLRNALVMSNAMGCTMMGNAALARAALPVPETAFMHDWWLLLVALALGVARVVNAPLVRYRQHGKNTLGADIWRGNLLRKCIGGLRRSRSNIRQTRIQAEALLQRYGRDMAQERLAMYRAWADRHSSWPVRVGSCLRLGFRKPGLLRNGAFLLCQ